MWNVERGSKDDTNKYGVIPGTAPAAAAVAVVGLRCVALFVVSSQCRVIKRRMACRRKDSEANRPTALNRSSKEQATDSSLCKHAY